MDRREIEATIEPEEPVGSLAPRSVGELMTADPVVVAVDSDLGDVAELMDFYQVSGLPVCDRSGALVGLISQTDLVRARATEGLWSSWPGLTAGHLMSRPVLTVRVDTPLVEAARTMEAHGVHRLVVIGADGRTPVGVVSMTDLVHWIATETGGTTA